MKRKDWTGGLFFHLSGVCDMGYTIEVQHITRCTSSFAKISI